MNIIDLNNSLPYLFEAQLTAFIWGHAGIGKTTTIKDYAKSKGYHFFPLYLGTQSDIGDILGLAGFIKDANGSEIATHFATPIWLKNAIDYCEANPESGAIIFLDEFNRARSDIMQGMFSLALDKTFHTIKLPTNCHIIAAGNPPTDEYTVTDITDNALMSRFVHIKLEPTVEEWLEYAKKSNTESSLVSFIKEQPGLLEDHKSGFDIPIKADRRAYARLDKLFKVKTPEYLLKQLMQGILGIEKVVLYEQHCAKTEKPLSADEVFLGDFKRASDWSTDTEIKSSLFNVTCDNIVAAFKSLDEKQTLLTEDQQGNLVTFFRIVPKDIAFACLKTTFAAGMDEKSNFQALNKSKYHDELFKMLSKGKGKKAA